MSWRSVIPDPGKDAGTGRYLRASWQPARVRSELNHYGVLSTYALLTARRPGLQPALWTCWGREWARRGLAVEPLASAPRDAAVITTGGIQLEPRLAGHG